jgi:hypothetical protein
MLLCKVTGWMKSCCTYIHTYILTCIYSYTHTHMHGCMQISSVPDLRLGSLTSICKLASLNNEISYSEWITKPGWTVLASTILILFMYTTWRYIGNGGVSPVILNVDTKFYLLVVSERGSFSHEKLSHYPHYTRLGEPHRRSRRPKREANLLQTAYGDKALSPVQICRELGILNGAERMLKTTFAVTGMKRHSTHTLWTKSAIDC